MSEKLSNPEQITNSLESPETNTGKGNLAHQLESSFGGFQGSIFGARHETPAKEFEAAKRENEKVVEKINQFLATKVVPKTYDLMTTNPFSPELQTKFASRFEKLPPEFVESVKRRLGKKDNKDVVMQVVDGTYHASRQRGDELLLLAGLLVGRRVLENEVEQVMPDVFKGKKILVLGDDVGTLSEILNRLGATAYGIENYPWQVQFARWGTFAEDEQPQNQLIEGNVGDLMDRESELSKKMKELGPFDIIHSHLLFNGGSGINDTVARWQDKNRAYFMSHFLLNSENLLGEKGFSAHNKMDMQTNVFGPALDYKIIDELRQGSKDAEHLLKLVENNGCFGAHLPIPVAGDGVLIAKKGLMELAKQMRPELFKDSSNHT